MCKNPHYNDHHEDINCFYESIIVVLKLFASDSIPTSVTSTRYIVSEWNEYVKEHRSLAKDAL